MISKLLKILLMSILYVTLGVGAFWALVEISAMSPTLQEAKLRMRVEPGTVLVLNPARNTSGSGFQVANSKGSRFIVTNKHVCDTSTDFEVKWHDLLSFPTKKIAMSPKHDLCLLAPLNELRTLKLVDNEDFYWGETVYSVGHPNGNNTHVADGRLIGYERDMDTFDINLMGKDSCKTAGGFDVLNITEETLKNGDTPEEVCNFPMQKYFFTSIIIRGGNSGSPMVNLDGEVMGVFTKADHWEWGLSIPVEYVREFIEEQP